MMQQKKLEHKSDRIKVEEMISVWNTVLEQDDYESQTKTTGSLLRIEPFPAAFGTLKHE